MTLTGRLHRYPNARIVSCLILLLLGLSPFQAFAAGANHDVLAALNVKPDSSGILETRRAMSVDGTPIDLIDSGSLTLLNFWASWCKPCRKELSELESIQSKAQRARVRIITANVGEDTETIRRYVRDLELTLPVIEGDQGKTLYKRWFDVTFTQLPATLIIQPGGRLLARTLGVIDVSSKPLRNVLETRIESLDRQNQNETDIQRKN